MMCRRWAPGARQPGRTVVRPLDMTLNGRCGVTFGGNKECEPKMTMLRSNWEHYGGNPVCAPRYGCPRYCLSAIVRTEENMQTYTPDGPLTAPCGRSFDPKAGRDLGK